jgi:hypothetical protein
MVTSQVRPNAVIARAAVACAACIVATVSCTRGPIELGFWIEQVSFASPRLGDPISHTEMATIESIARAEIATAFDCFDVALSGNRRARYHVRVVQRLLDQRFRSREVSVAGESRGAAGWGGSGAVSFDFLAGSAMVYAPEAVGRAELIAAIGRGIGRSAVHEFAHQLLPSAPIHDSRDRASYEFESAARIEQYFGNMRWALAKPLLEDRLGLR